MNDPPLSVVFCDFHRLSTESHMIDKQTTAAALIETGYVPMSLASTILGRDLTSEIPLDQRLKRGWDRDAFEALDTHLPGEWVTDHGRERFISRQHTLFWQVQEALGCSAQQLYSALSGGSRGPEKLLPTKVLRKTRRGFLVMPNGFSYRWKRDWKSSHLVVRFNGREIYSRTYVEGNDYPYRVGMIRGLHPFWSPGVADRWLGEETFHVICHWETDTYFVREYDGSMLTRYVEYSGSREECRAYIDQEVEYAQRLAAEKAARETRRAQHRATRA